MPQKHYTHGSAMNGFMPGASLLVKVGQERQEQAVADL
jgi:hypothetical protein